MDMLVESLCRKAAERLVGRDSGRLVEQTAAQLREELRRAILAEYTRGMRDWQAQMSLPLG